MVQGLAWSLGLKALLLKVALVFGASVLSTYKLRVVRIRL